MGDLDIILELTSYDKGARSPLEDATSELAAILGVSAEEAERLMKQTLDGYHHVGGVLPAEISHELGMLAASLAQSYRIPFMVERMAPLNDRLGNIKD
jgi:hypothetical protein